MIPFARFLEAESSAFLISKTQKVLVTMPGAMRDSGSVSSKPSKLEMLNKPHTSLESGNCSAYAPP